MLPTAMRLKGMATMHKMVDKDKMKTTNQTQNLCIRAVLLVLQALCQPLLAVRAALLTPQIGTLLS